MVLTNDAKELLAEAFEEFQKSGQRIFCINFDEDDEPEDKARIHNALDLLEDYFLIEDAGSAIGFVQFKITAEGLEYCSDPTEPVSPVQFIQGDNNIIIHGSGNLVSGCYNSIHSEIQSSDLPDSTKQLIESLLSSMQDTSLSPEKKKSAIGSFLQELTAGALSNTASAGLTEVLSQLFQNLPF